MTTAERLKKVESTLAELNIRMAGAGGGGGTPHNLLSATHPDTDPDSPVRGDILRGIAGPEWQRYALGAAGTYLRSDGNDIVFSAIQVGDLPAHAALHELGGGDQVDHDNLLNYVANEHIDWTNAVDNFKTTGTIEGSTAKLSDLTDGYVPYHVSDAAGLANSPIYSDGTKIGIGGSPTTRLVEIIGAQQDALQYLFDVRAKDAAGSVKALIVGVDAGTPEILITTVAQGTDPRLSFSTAAVPAQITLLINGNVGIGVVAPAAKLQVQDVTSAYNSEIGNFQIQNSVDTTKKMWMGIDTALGAHGSVYLQGVKAATAYLPLLLNPISGNVGIGTITPASILETSTNSAQYWNVANHNWQGSVAPIQALMVTNIKPGGYDPVIMWRGATSTGVIKPICAIGAVGQNAWTEGDVATQISDMYFVLRDDADVLQERMRITHDGHIDIYDWDDSVLREVSFGADDSGGAGFKVLRVPN